MSDRHTHTFPDLPVVVIGGGPIGLAAAVHLLERGLQPLVLEAGSSPGAGVRSWGHVRVFSPWQHMIDSRARALLESRGWESPDPDSLPTGAEFADYYLDPLGAALGDALQLNTTVTGVSRYGVDKTRSANRERLPFQINFQNQNGPGQLLARGVIDASGTVRLPNPLGANGLPVPGEPWLSPLEDGGPSVLYRIPDVLGAERAAFEGSRTLVVGSGHSAFNTLLSLSKLRDESPDTEVTWAIRGARNTDLFGGGDGDELPARATLGTTVEARVREGTILFEQRFRALVMDRDDAGLRVSDGERTLGPFDRVVVNAGYRPDLEMLREVRTGLEPALDCPVALAPLIDPNVHSCGTVYPHGWRELSHPERDFFVVGMKSYGRAPTFLLLTGYEQVRSVAAALAGDLEAANAVELELPATGVCGGSDGVCC